VRIYAAPLIPQMDDQAKIGIRHAFGGPYLRIGALKAFADGSLGSGTAYFYEPFLHQGENRGLLSDEMQPISLMRDRMIKADADGLDIKALEFRAPGITQVRLSGRLAAQPNGVQFAGSTRIEANDPRAFVAWLSERTEAQTVAAGPLRLGGDITLGSDGIAIERLKLELDRMTASGRFAYAFASDNRPARLDAVLTAPEVDFDRVHALAKSVLGDTALDWPREGTLSLKIARASLAGVEAKQADVNMRIDANGMRIHAEWSLLATAGDGPYVPTLPALAVLRAMASGTIPPPGARTCVGIVDLAAIEREFARYRIDAELICRRVHSPFEAILGADFAQLPAPVRRLHGLSQDLVAAGLAEIDVAPAPVARLLCRLAGLPKAGREVPVSVSFRIDERGGEHWERRFARRRYAGGLRAGTGANAGLLVERFGPFDLLHRLTVSREGLAWRAVRWRLLGIPLPRWTLPRIDCRESAEGERFRFDIDVSFPLVGPVIHYRGWLVPAEPASERSGR